MRITKQFQVILCLLFGALGVHAQVDMKAMKAMYESRKPGLDTMAYYPDHFGMEYESIRTPTDDSILIRSWFIPNAANKGTVLMVHGFNMNKSHMLERARFFYKMGYAVLLPDLRARGESSGSKASTGESNVADLLSIIGYYEEQLSAHGELLFYGFSHGGRACIFTFPRLEEGHTLILEGVPYLLAESFKRVYNSPYAPPMDDEPIKEALHQFPVHSKVLVLIGDNDKAIIETEANDLLLQLKQIEKRLIVFPETKHQVFTDRNQELFRKSIQTIL